MAPRPFSLSFVLLISVFSAFMLGACASGSGGDEAASALARAEEAVISAYGAVLEAEGAGADVRDLADRLNNACSLLVEARFFYDAGNLDEAFRLANLCVEISGDVAREAVILRNLAVGQAEWNFRVTIALSFLSIAAITCASFYGWRVFKKRYFRRVLGMKPEVVSVEP